MTTEELRQKYPKFIFEKFEYKITGENLEISYYYSILPDHKFTHTLNLPITQTPGNLENLIFHIGLSLMPSYWKLTCSPDIEVQAGFLSPEQVAWWHKLFIKGMGEYFFRNNIDFTYQDFLTITSSDNPPLHPPLSLRGGPERVLENRVLVPVGGGKDSIVTLEILKPHFSTTDLIINPFPEIINVCHIAGFDQPLIVKSTIDPYLLQLNEQGYLNGHVPLSAFYAFVSVAVAALTNHKYIAFSNERSSNEGNTEYLNYTINHQYSKTLEFETDFQSYSHKYLSPDITYFSFLRPLYELQIALAFSHFPQYFKSFVSCNNNFKTNPADRPQNSLWCCHCPKCVSTALLLAAWLSKSKVTDIMGTYPPDLPENSEIMKDLLGINPIKPFECVLTHDEAHIAQDIIAHGLTSRSRLFISSWLDNPNLPPEFENILRAAVLPS